eukprot:s4283_g9.t1
MSRKCMKTTEVPEEVLQFLRSLSDQGVLQDALHQVMTSTGGSSMNDASKRRGDEISENVSEHGDFQLIRDSPKTGGSDSSTQVAADGTVTIRGVILPRGVADLDTWGRTVCTLPKVEKRGMNYEELIEESKKSPDTLRYLRWVKANAPVSAKVKDLGDYMQASGVSLSDEQSGAATSVCYPGTTEVRKLK